MLWPYKPLIGINLMSFPSCQISKYFSAAFTQQVTRLSSKSSAHVVVLAVDGEIALGPYGSRKGSLIDLYEPVVRIDGLGNSRQGRKGWASHTRRLVATGARLIGALLVVMSQKRLGELRNLRERGWSMDLQALLTKRAMKSFDVRIQIGSTRGDNIGYHPKTEQEAHQCRGEIPSGRAANKAWIIVKGEHGRQAMLAQKLDDRFKQGFGIEIATHLTVQPDGGASIDKIGNLHDMLALPFWISGDLTSVLQIELDFLPWLS
jgi:hypothetical protein